MWGGALAGAVALGIYHSRREVLRVNELEGAITFLAGGKPVTVAREQIRGVDVTTETRNLNGLPYEVYPVMILWRNALGEEEATKLVEYEDRPDAEAFAEWLRERLGLPAKSAHLAPSPYQPV
jgi:hypothetical protein